MNNYLVMFIGREIGSIGAVGRFTVTVLAENEEKARQELYKTHEHIIIEVMEALEA